MAEVLLMPEGGRFGDHNDSWAVSAYLLLKEETLAMKRASLFDFSILH